ncbi:hypothetical protein [Providencia alcalifaciens]|uniref:hypothetical protein n=1 Tax=Providencia alcalifaciens TaxID=126385 RepID=UPI000450646C|nr:hypothetical protein [Providencia alcalifaciens]EUC95750.1 hypothetical protein HMPREF1567_2476 [Providencia alcalifaciens PAL-2]MTC38495.1 hypothetical protein [Providencia alcalifaciens]
MDITIECDSVQCEARMNRNVEVTLTGAILDGFISVDDIISEYSAGTLLDEIDNDDIISHLECQGYTVTKD